MPTHLLQGAAAMMLLLFAASAMAEDGVPLSDPVAIPSQAADPAGQPEADPVSIAPSTPIGEPLSVDRLADMRGGAEVIETTIDVDGTVDGNTAVDVTTGSNNITGGSFANAAGLNTVIQNTGANVLIQNATSVQIEFADPTP